MVPFCAPFVSAPFILAERERDVKKSGIAWCAAKARFKSRVATPKENVAAAALPKVALGYFGYIAVGKANVEQVFFGIYVRGLV